MKFLKQGIALLLCLLLAGCGAQSDDTQPSTQPQPTLSAPQKYDAALQKIAGAENLILDYTLSNTRTVGPDTYPETVTGTASFSAIGQDEMVAVVEEQLTYGTYSTAYTEVYCNDAAYARVNESTFTALQTPQEFIGRQIPSVLLSSGLYQSVTEQPVEDGTLITFAQPTALEHWLEASSQAQLISAGGTATLNHAGDLIQSTYQAEYIRGDAKYVFQITVRLTTPKSLDLTAKHSVHFEGCPVLESLDVPKMLLQVVGDVYVSQSMTCDAVESIYSEAIPVSYTQKSKYFLAGSADALKVTAEYEIDLSDYRGEVTTKTQVDRFQDGVFTSTVDGETVVQPNVTAQTMRQYCEDAILSALVAPKYLSGAAIREENGCWKLEFTGNDAFVTDFMASIIQFLQVDLEANAESAETTEAKGSLTIDMDTGLPVAMSISLQRSHTLEGVSYVLTYQLDQTVTLSAENE